MDLIEAFTKLRDISDSVIKALKSKDEEQTMNALGKFALLMIEFEAIKDK